MLLHELLKSLTLNWVYSSLVIDTLAETDKSIPTIYFYCNYGESERRQTSFIVRSLLKQLSTVAEKLDPRMVSVFNNGTSLNTKSSETAFSATLAQFDKCFVVVDALDECSEEERKSLVMILTRQLRLEGCHVKLFLTSRPENDLHGLLKGSHSHQIDTDDTSKDIKPFVAAELASRIADGKLLGGKVTSELREELVDTISAQADGMYVPY